MDFAQLLNSDDYQFLKTNPRLGNRIILMGVGGSYAYGINNGNSDIDFRGTTLNLPSDMLGLTKFEQYEDENTDTVIYSFNKIIKLLLECNPNTIELLGLDEDQYLIKTTLGQELLDHKNMLGVMNNVIREYDKIGKRNKKKDDNHLNKHAMHLIRLFMMAIDILEKNEIRTHRTDNLELLRSIRRGDFQKEDKTFSQDFYDMLSEYVVRLGNIG